jgi:hypothetical protein
VRINGIQLREKQVRNCIAIFLGAALVSTGCAKAGPADGSTIYDSNPDHLWNRLNKTLFERTAQDGEHYGLNQLDILYWGRTTNLLAGASHQQALAVLNEFINKHGEKLVQDPLKKALLQRDLWALFDWSVRMGNGDFAVARKELQQRLAITIQRLELTTNEIASLPDNYALAEKNNLTDLPRGLFNTNGVWINITIPNALGLVPAHELSFGGRSTFMVLFHDANGRKAGLNYLKQLHSVEPMFVASGNTNEPITMNHFPQFPASSQWSLARRMRVIDADGKIQTTHVVESIQLRTYLRLGKPDYVEVTNVDGRVDSQTIPPQQFNEFQITRPSAEMISLGQKERGFIKILFSNGLDPFEFSGFGSERSSIARNDLPIALQTCFQCHSGPGIYSVNSFTRVFSLELPRAETTEMVESDGTRGDEEEFFSLKESRADWGLLQGLWMQNK